MKMKMLLRCIKCGAGVAIIKKQDLTAKTRAMCVDCSKEIARGLKDVREKAAKDRGIGERS